MTSKTNNETASCSEIVGSSPVVTDEVYRLTFELARVGIAHLGPEGEMLRANKYFCDLLGYAEAEMASLPLLRLAHPADVEIAEKILHRTVRGDAPDAPEELRLVRKTGEATYVALSIACPAYSPANRRIAMIEDIDARKQAEEALRKTEERFSLAMRGSDEGLYDWNVGEGTTYLSPRWKSMLGYEDVDLETSPNSWEQLLAPGSLDSLNEQIALLESGLKSTYEVELKLRHRDGRWLDILSRACPVFDETTELPGSWARIWT